MSVAPIARMRVTFIRDGQSTGNVGIRAAFFAARVGNHVHSGGD